MSTAGSGTRQIPAARSSRSYDLAVCRAVGAPADVFWLALITMGRRVTRRASRVPIHSQSAPQALNSGDRITPAEIARTGPSRIGFSAGAVGMPEVEIVLTSIV